MARQPRNEIAAGLYHAFARGVDKQTVFRDEVDKRTYLGILGRVVEAMNWRCLGFCLMPNHIHLIIETRKPNLGRGMQKLHGEYGSAFNVRHGRVGHLFQGRFRSIAIESDEQLWVVAAYLAQNPVKAGLCENIEDWPWSSHQSLIRRSGPQWLDSERLLSFFACAGGDARARYLQHVAREGTEGTVPVSFTGG